MSGLANNVNNLFAGNYGGANEAAGYGSNFNAPYNAAEGQVGSLYAPFLTAGATGLSNLTSLFADPSQITKTPGYEFALNQGEAAVQNQAGVTGSPFGGAASMAMENYASGLASQTYQQQVQNYMSLAGLGANAAGANAGNIAQLFGALTGAQSSTQSAEIGRGGSIAGQVSNFLGL